MVELQDLLEKQNYELAQMKERMSSLSSRVSEVEQELETARKDLIKSEEINNKYQRDIKEVTARAHVHTHARARHTSKQSVRPRKRRHYQTHWQAQTGKRLMNGATQTGGVTAAPFHAWPVFFRKSLSVFRRGSRMTRVSVSRPCVRRRTWRNGSSPWRSAT